MVTVTYIVVFEETALAKARAFDALWSQSAHRARDLPETLFDYYYGKR